MHELGIAARIVDVAVERAAAAGRTRITDVHLEIGTESGIAPGSIELYWPQVTRATIAEGAHLHVCAAEDPRSFRLVAIDVADGPDPAPGRDRRRRRAASGGGVERAQEASPSGEPLDRVTRATGDRDVELGLDMLRAEG